jgi:hypothetical protein
MLQNTLVAILKIFIRELSFNHDVGNALTQSPNLFKNIVDAIKENKIVLKTVSGEPEVNIGDILSNELLQAFFTILGKGAGDIFQEINAVCKNGGYITGPSYSLNSNIFPWNDQGNAKRLFIATDRPSGTRFIFLLRYGTPDYINDFAFGGYIYHGKGKTETIFAKRSEGKVCDYGKGQSGFKRRFEETGDNTDDISDMPKKRGGMKIKKHTKKHKRFKKNNTKKHNYVKIIKRKFTKKNKKNKNKKKCTKKNLL